MKNLNVKLVLAATAFSFGAVVNAATLDGKGTLLLAHKDNGKQAKEEGDKSDKARSDTAITANVKEKFVKEKLFGDLDVSAMSISVETNKGIVKLTGTADNQAQIKNAVKLAKSVEGVKGVINKVKVKRNGSNKNKNEDNKKERKKDNDSDHKS